MGTRDRLERKLEKREDWAAGRRAKADGLDKQNERYRGDVAFNTQPGHIPERARAIKRTERAGEHRDVAQHHEEKAEGLARQLDNSIYSDDDNAVEALEARITSMEAQRDRIKRFNASARKGEPDVSILDDAQKKELEGLRQIGSVFVGKGGSFPRYVLANLSGNIKRNRDRLVQIKRQQATAARAEQSADGVLVETFADGRYAKVTFAEKPDRDILNALKAAGYRWGSGSWTGETSKLPDVVKGVNE